MNDWHPEDIKMAIRKRGATMASIGRDNHLSRQVVANALIEPNSKAELAIASFLNVPAYLIWPSRYGNNGRRLTPQPSENYERKARFHHQGAAA